MKWCGLAISLRMSALGLNCGKRRAYSEPARLRDQFTERKRPKDSDRPRPENQNKTQNIAYRLEAGVLHLTAVVADAPANWGLRRASS
jgi:hypothetical protein